MPNHPIKRFLPKTLFGRALLILIAPTLLLQLFLVYQFYERHWDSVVRHMSSSLAGEVVLIYREYMNQPSFAKAQTKAELLGIRLWLDESPNVVIDRNKGQRDYREFYRQLNERLQLPFMVERTKPEEELLISLLVDKGVLRMQTTEKRLVSSTTYIFLLWSVGSSIVLLVIATLFLRNQIRPIRQLANVAERFGLGQQEQAFRPSGAQEVRQAGRAFLVMQSRIVRQVTTRTEMLAGISHDLRTPLTRMKLQLEMMTISDKQREELGTDISEMEHMIEEYLQFARGSQQEQSEPTLLAALLTEIAESYTRQHQPVQLQIKHDAELLLRPKAIRRAVQNIIDNALRYGKEASIKLSQEGAYMVISVSDKGPGIPDAQKQEAFRPFTRLDPSRSQNTSGAGLGLSICRDIIQSHGGTVELRNRKKGLEVQMNLPWNKDGAQAT